MKHRGQWHIHITGPEVANGVIGTKGNGKGQCVEHKLAVGEMDPFRVASGAGGIEGRGLGIFIKVGKVELR